MAAISDLVQELILLEAVFAMGNNSSFLWVALIARQNSPEEFSVCRELHATLAFKPTKVITLFFNGNTWPIAGVTAYLRLSSFQKLLLLSCFVNREVFSIQYFKM
jgi:hypothetical protein